MKSPFVAEAVIALLRSGQVPADTDSIVLDRLPLIDALRERIVESDIPLLTSIVVSGDGCAAGLATSLLRRLISNPLVRDCFEDRWATAGPYLKNRLMWRLLDIPDLPESRHEEFRAFVFSQWDLFQEFNHGFFGPVDALGNVLSRILDASCPASKKWAHLCSACGVTAEREHLRAVIEVGLLLPNRFAQETAQLLLDRFFGADTNWIPLEQQVETPSACDLGFLADAVISRLRSGNMPNQDESDWLNRLPLVDILRARIAETDLEWVWPVVESESGERVGLYLSLLRAYTKRPAIQERLRRLFQSADPCVRSHLLWRILDDPQLSPAWHEALFRFVLAEWASFQSVSVKFLGTPRTPVTQVLKRIGDPTFPESKKWAYLCHLCRVPPVAEDQEAARALVTFGLQMKDEFTRKVAAELLQRFF